MSVLLHAFLACFPTRSLSSTSIPNPLALPNELWTEIFLMLDTEDILRASRVSETFNALAMPLYLARFGIKQAEVRAGELNIPASYPRLLSRLRTAFFLPPITSLSCAVAEKGRYEILRYLSHFLRGSPSSRDRVQISFLGTNAFSGYGFHWRRRATPERKMKIAVCALLNALMVGTSRTLVVSGRTGRTILLDPIPPRSRRGPWRVVTQPMAPPHSGFRPWLRHAMHIGRPAVVRDLTLLASFNCEGMATRTSETVDDLRSIDVHYNVGGGGSPWSVVILNAGLTKVYKLPVSMEDFVPDKNLTWDDILPLLAFPNLLELQMTSGTPFGSATDQDTPLHEISVALMDDFLVRHPTIEQLEYLPQLPPLDDSLPLITHGFTALTHLTTTAFHFVRAFQDPECAQSLVQLRLLDVASRPMTNDVLVGLLHILSLRKLEAGCETMRLSMPAAWASVLSTTSVEEPQLDTIDSVNLLHLFDLRLGDNESVESLITSLLAFISLFNPTSLRIIQLQPPLSQPASSLCLRVADALRVRADWLEDVVRVRARETGFFQTRTAKGTSKSHIPAMLIQRLRAKKKGKAKAKATATATAKSAQLNSDEVWMPDDGKS
ncbi:hypothetical protein C8F01DRAFT_1236153 [Mycena amicta]|nr:hypothetical protein C8F01DRAFT_1236153 [Mycena amicta]